MNNTNIAQLHNSSSDHGFTLIEVLVGIIMATIFVLITSQAIAISAIYRVRAQRETEALNWVQDDLENIKFNALRGNLPAATCDPSLGETTQGYADSLMQEVGSGTTTTSITLLNKEYSATRTTFVYNAPPYHMMGVSYSIINPDGGEEITNFYTEVIPDAAFDC